MAVKVGAKERGDGFVHFAKDSMIYSFLWRSVFGANFWSSWRGEGPVYPSPILSVMVTPVVYRSELALWIEYQKWDRLSSRVFQEQLGRHSPSNLPSFLFFVLGLNDVRFDIGS